MVEASVFVRGKGEIWNVTFDSPLPSCGDLVEIDGGIYEVSEGTLVYQTHSEQKLIITPAPPCRKGKRVK